MTPRGITMNGRVLGSITLGLAALGGALAIAYRDRFQPWQARWGATDDEAGRSLPGDDLLGADSAVTTRAITVHAPVAAVWPWLAQLGQERGGFYSYEWMENLIGCDIRNADRIHPEWQQVVVGDVVRLAAAARYPQMYLLVALVEPGRVLLLRSPDVGTTRDNGVTDFSFTWAFVLDQINSTTTRLVVRSHYRGSGTGTTLLGLGPFIMERRMLLGIKERAEHGYQHSDAATRHTA